MGWNFYRAKWFSPILTREQKKLFGVFFPQKVYKLERTFAIVIALSQILMLTIFAVKEGSVFPDNGKRGYVISYLSLLLVTLVCIPLYNYLIHKGKYASFRWLRRFYVWAVCIWIMAITYFDQINGVGIEVYCYLLPTIAAVLLMTPFESVLILGATWAAIIVLFIVSGVSQEALFGNVVNSTFVTIVSMIISNRYYRGTTMEFRDRQTIEKQYARIKESNQLLNKMAYTDQLTGLGNRRYLAEKVYPIFSAFQKQKKFATILMVDIDYFKQYNDYYGHLQGDECLKQLTGVILDYCKGTEIMPVRYGGEEFLMIHVTDQVEDITIIAEEVRQRIIDAKIEREDVEKQFVTVSIGVWAGELVLVDHIETAIQYADEALYQAKNSGRDCICYY